MARYCQSCGREITGLNYCYACVGAGQKADKDRIAGKTAELNIQKEIAMENLREQRAKEETFREWDRETSGGFFAPRKRKTY